MVSAQIREDSRKQSFSINLEKNKRPSTTK